MLAWDRVFGRVHTGRIVETPGTSIQRMFIPSGKNLLDAVVVRPVLRPEHAVLLICHGIGEVVEHWTAAQRLLAAYGVSALVFDYSGYGGSSGFISAARCEQDAICAFQYLQSLVPSLPISILGFSMGSGIAAAILEKTTARRLVLCAAFPSFKEAALGVRWPRSLAFLVPDIWRTKDALSKCSLPVLLVHGEKDQLFPSHMAVDLKSSCGAQTKLIVVPELTHGDPFYHPQPSYWGPVAEFLLAQSKWPSSK